MYFQKIGSLRATLLVLRGSKNQLIEAKRGHEKGLVANVKSIPNMFCGGVTIDKVLR